jgi:phospholipase C
MVSSPLHRLSPSSFSTTQTSIILKTHTETGGWADHVVPYHAPPGTPIEWVQDPYGDAPVYTGPGFRLPFYIISPYTRGGSVFSEHADHNSQLLFLETWLSAKGYTNISTPLMNPWRRAHMSNLVNAFDFSSPDWTIPVLPTAPQPHTDSSGNWDGSSYCESLYPDPQPKVPFGVAEWQPSDMASLSEKGFKAVRGALTEGRYLAFELGGYALQNGAAAGNSTGGKGSGNGNRTASALVAGPAAPLHDRREQLWVVHQVADGGVEFTISSALDGRFIGQALKLVDGASAAATFEVVYRGGGLGYSVQFSNGQFLGIQRGKVVTSRSESGFALFSVTGFE